MVPFGKSFVWGIYKTFLKDHLKQIKVAISSFIGQVNFDSSSIGTCLMNSISFAGQNNVLSFKWIKFTFSRLIPSFCGLDYGVFIFVGQHLSHISLYWSIQCQPGDHKT